MRVGWLVDDVGYTGGAEITQAEFRAACPTGVEIIDCPPGGVQPGLDRYVIHNCLTYKLEDLHRIGCGRTVRYWHDVGMWYPPDVRKWLDENTTAVCCSQLQADYMGLSDARLIPPPINLEPFRQAAQSVNGNRRGVVSVAAWRNSSKGADAVAKWAASHGQPVDFYGGGVAAPAGSREIAYQGMPLLLAHYETFVFLPNLIEPFGRTVAEAWAAGCQLVTNRLVGALEWIEGDPGGMERATIDFWQLVVEG